MAPEETAEAIAAGRWPAELVEACRRWGVAPGALLGWALRPDGVTAILPGGAKASASIRGEWAAEPASAQPAATKGKKQA
jgi:hypothetical protein